MSEVRPAGLPPQPGPGAPPAPSPAPAAPASPRVALPEVGTGERRARRDRRRARGRRRSLAIAAGAGALLVLLAVVALVVRGGDGGDEARRSVEAAATSVVPEESAPPVSAPRSLLVQQGAGGELVSVTVLVVDESGAGGRLVFAPVGTMVEVPSFGLNPLREAFALGGLPLLQQSAENLLGIVFDQVSLVGAEELAALVEPAGVLAVELDASVEVVADGGRVETLFPAGVVDVAPDGVARLLEVRGSGNDLERLVRHQALWQAWLAAVAGNDAAAPPADVAGGLGETVAALAAGGVGYDLLPVEVLATGTGPTDDLYAVQAEELEVLVAEVAPGSTLPSADRVRVQVLNGTGAPGLSQQVQPALAAAGAVVSLTGNADRFDYQVSQVVFYRDEDLEAAQAVQRALGVGEVVRSLVPLDVVDVTVVVGADFAGDTSTTAPDTTTTPETTTTTASPGP